MTPQRWSALMSALGLGPEPDTYRRLIAAYAEPHRHYHTGHHIDACLRELDGATGLAEAPAEVELALWFHDAVYDVRGHDNEQRSADWAKAFLQAAGAAPGIAARVAGLVMATQHRAPAEERDAALVVDIDLAILGQADDAYDVFERQIRAEYRYVPLSIYRRKRAEILRSFLEREHIYRLGYFQDRYERHARANLSKAIDMLT